MITVKVINKGKRVRDRVGVRFVPNKEYTVTVSKNQFVSLRAVKDFYVEEVTEETVPEEEVEEEPAELEDEEELIENLKSMNVEDFLQKVKESNIDIDTAIAIETTGKNRVTLIEQLEELKEQGE